jgi:NADH-quinone oxidoreductase subunit I
MTLLQDYSFTNGELMTEYFKKMFNAIKSILTGMGITIKYGVNPKTEVTQQYPEVKREPPDRFRGKLFVDINICTGCTACARICPVDAITLKTVRDENKKLRPVVFDIDNARCIYCGLCVEACPVEHCLYFEKKYEFSAYTKDELISHFGLGELKPQEGRVEEKKLEPKKEEVK